MTLGTDDLARIQEVVQEMTGVVLGDDKGYLVESRPGPVLQPQNHCRTLIYPPPRHPGTGPAVVPARGR